LESAFRSSNCLLGLRHIRAGCGSQYPTRGGVDDIERRCARDKFAIDKKTIGHFWVLQFVNLCFAR
jgi:hypothetical protein